ncbi:MAG TPA: hypothetical protein VFW06_00360 [Acidimicrobiia bacterium]|nr:hypothetical protein [Acidimicrobiia bacterium]
MSKARTTTTRTRATKAKGCVMPACTATRVRGKVYCSTHAPVARERIRMAAGEAAWA